MFEHGWTPEKDRQLMRLLTEHDDRDRFDAIRYRLIRDLRKSTWVADLFATAGSSEEFTRRVDEKAAEIDRILSQYAPKEVRP